MYCLCQSIASLELGCNFVNLCGDPFNIRFLPGIACILELGVRVNARFFDSFIVEEV